MFRSLARGLVSPIMIVVFNLLMLVPMGLAAFEVARGLPNPAFLHDALEILTGIGVLMIGWGVVLEERATLREAFDIKHAVDEERQDGLDRLCHHFGLSQLVLGLLVEICVEMVRLPDKIVNTSGIEAPVAGLGLCFIVVGAILLVIHIIRLLARAVD